MCHQVFIECWLVCWFVGLRGYKELCFEGHSHRDLTWHCFDYEPPRRQVAKIENVSNERNTKPVFHHGQTCWMLFLYVFIMNSFQSISQNQSSLSLRPDVRVFFAWPKFATYFAVAVQLVVSGWCWRIVCIFLICIRFCHSVKLYDNVIFFGCRHAIDFKF